MKSIAFIITRENMSELIEDDILTPILTGEFGVKTVAFYFVGDGVYQLIKGSRNAKNMKAIIKMGQTSIYACETSIKNRKLQNVVIDGVKMGTMKDFFETTADVDHIISF